ncbi:MAG: 50S ribosomal protein L3 [Rickettsiaceae bacterium]|nr:50S ribosomal protein L3 [Rickettsiaceae bacterium]
MRSGLIAKKLGMTSTFTDRGERISLTLLKIDNCQVVTHKTKEKDGYNALVIGSTIQKATKVSKSMRKVFANAKIEPRAKLKEFRVTEEGFLDVGTEIKADHYQEGQYVDVTGVSIGKGFAGGMKRHNFSGLEATHGVSISHRSHGSTGGCQDPGKVFKNKKMAGQMGNTQVTMQNLRIFSVDVEKGLVIVSGNVPGAKGCYVFIKDAVKKAMAA